MTTTIIFGLILSLLLCVGAVQSFLFLRRCYQRATAWLCKLKEAVRRLEVDSLAPKPNDHKVVEPSKKELSEGTGRIFVAQGDIAEDQYTLSSSVTSEELEQLGRTLSAKTAPIEQEIVAAKTAAKISNTPLLDAFLGATGDRVKDMFSNVATHISIQSQRGFDYSQYITK